MQFGQNNWKGPAHLSLSSLAITHQGQVTRSSLASQLQKHISSLFIQLLIYQVLTCTLYSNSKASPCFGGGFLWPTQKERQPFSKQGLQQWGRCGPWLQGARGLLGERVARYVTVLSIFADEPRGPGVLGIHLVSAPGGCCRWTGSFLVNRTGGRVQKEGTLQR